MRSSDTTLDIALPLIANTIDERIERTVRMRASAGSSSCSGRLRSSGEHGLADEPAQPLPAAFAEALRVELGP